MIAAWMAYTMLVGALLAIAAVGAESALRASRHSIRFVWGAAIALTFVFAVIAPMRRKPTVDLSWLSGVPSVTHEATYGSPSLIERIRSAMREATNNLSAPVQTLSTRVAVIAWSKDRAIFAGWAVASTAALTVFGSAYGRFARRRTSWPNATLQGVDVRITPDVGPAVLGIAPPTIVIPQWVLGRNDVEQRLVVAHEREHVRAHDPLLLLACCVAVALMPWNVALWFMWSRLRLAVEVDCDGRVLRSGAPKQSYSHLLLELSARRARLSPLMPAFAFGTSHLEQRLVAMTTRPSRYQNIRRFSSVSVVMVALVVACNGAMPTSEQIERMDVMTAATKYPSLAQAAFTIDGRAATFAEASAIPATQIRSIEVKRPTKQKPQQTVDIKLNAMTVASYVGDTIALRGGASITAARGDSSDVRFTGRAPGSSTLLIERQRPASVAGGDTLVMRDRKNVEAAMRGDTIVFRDANGATLTASRADSLRVQVLHEDSVASRNRQSTGASRTDSGTLRVGVRAPAGSNGERQIDHLLFRRDSTERVNPLVIIDGKVVTGNPQVDPRDIDTIEIIKGYRAREMYGDAAVNGVISIKLRH